jgi:hypothetical protein
MGSLGIESRPLFQLRAETFIEAEVDAVYALVTDLPRSGEWSPECLGGEWISGTPRETQAIFRGKNQRAEDVVGWAPVVRGVWHTSAVVIRAEPGRIFEWAMLDSSGNRQESIWGFEINQADGGSILAHTFRMGAPTEGIRGITAEMDAETKRRFFDEWGRKVHGDLAATLARIKKVVERD